MKRTGITLLLFLLSFSLFAASKPSIEGRAQVANEGELPTGLFAKAIGFLPGDSVAITNPAVGITVNVLILGTLEKQDEIAVLLSPEAASRLFIKKNSNVTVSVTKRTGAPDEVLAAPKNAVSDPDSKPTDALPSGLVEKLSQQQSVAPTEEPAVPFSTPDVKTSPEANTRPVPAAPPVSGVSNSGSVPDVRIRADSVGVIQVIQTPPEPQADSPAPPAVVPAEWEGATTKISDIGDKFQIPNEKPVVTIAPPRKVDTPPEDAIALPLPPASVTVKPLPKPALSATQPTVTPQLMGVVTDASKLRAGSYYVQIATMSSEKNINNVLTTYGDKYQFALIPSTISNAYKVLIGPLTADEYGVVLERFKNNGFKDAFLYKTK
jgi:hypothetical protein